MLLTKFKLVRTEGLKGLMLQGRLIPFEKIDDTLAEQLINQTHVLERLPGPEPAATSEALALPEATDGKKKEE
jgi:hypothetical protein